jgi:hypothetical protein
MRHAYHTEHKRSGTVQGAKRLISRSVGVPPAQMQPGSGFPLQSVTRNAATGEASACAQTLETILDRDSAVR